MQERGERSGTLVTRAKIKREAAYTAKVEESIDRTSFNCGLQTSGLYRRF